MLNLLGVIIAFVIVIILIRRKFNFGLSLIIGSLVVALFSLFSDADVTPIDVPNAFIQATINLDTILLAILLTLIYILAKCMQETGVINKMISSLRTIFYKGGILGVIPAVYGLMPVPGGALFSAPLIDKEGEKYKLSQDRKNFLNVWFRHIWFPIFPVSSAMMLIIGSEYSNIDIYELIVANFPAFIAFIVIGLLYIKFFINKVPKAEKPPEREYSGLIYLLPPTIPIFIYILFAIVFFIAGWSNLKDYQISIFIAGVILSLIVLFYLLKMDGKDYFKLIKKSFSLNLALIIFGIMIFRQLIELSEANVIITELIGGLPFHPIFIVILIPLIMGLLTGYNLGAIALSYLLVQPFFLLTGINMIGITSLVFISSLVGYLISPIHLCNVVSSDCLKTDTTRMYKMYIPASIMLLIVQTAFIALFYR